MTEIEYLDDDILEEVEEEVVPIFTDVKEEIFPTFSGGFVDMTADEEEDREEEDDEGEDESGDDESGEDESGEDESGDDEYEYGEEYIDLSECGSSVECDDSESDDDLDSDSDSEEEEFVPSIQNIDEKIAKKYVQPDFFDDEHTRSVLNNNYDDFEYGEVIDNNSSHNVDSKTPHFDEDIGGQSIASASIVAAGLLGCTVDKKSNKNMFLFGAVFLGIIGIASYFIWMKVNEMKKEISKLELQQNMVLDEKDIESVVAETIEGYLKRETEKTLREREELEAKDAKEQEIMYNNMKKSTLEPIFENENREQEVEQELEQEVEKELELEQEVEKDEKELEKELELEQELEQEVEQVIEQVEQEQGLEYYSVKELTEELNSEPIKKKRGRPRKSVSVL